MVLADEQAPLIESTVGHGSAGEPSLSSLARLVAGSQGAITKRIDLAVLEGQVLLSSTLRRAALVAFGLALAAGSWFATAACLVLLVNPHATPVLRLAAFGLLNAGGALGLVALAMRAWPPTPAYTSADESSIPKETQ